MPSHVARLGFADDVAVAVAVNDHVDDHGHDCVHGASAPWSTAG
jgi:hypothetical protein